MPPRLFTVTILVFWLIAMSWLFYRDLWPAIRPGERPPFTIDLSREAEGRKSSTYWILYRNGQKAGVASSQVVYERADQTYKLTTSIAFENFKLSVLRADFHVKSMRNTYHVTQEGELRRAEAEVKLDCTANGVDPAPLTILVEGDVADRFFAPRWRIQSSVLNMPFLNQEIHTEPVEIRSHDSML